MRNFFKNGKIFFWLGLFLAIYMFVILAIETSQNYNLRSKSDNLEIQINNLEAQIQDLGNKITYYKTDSYREKLAREKLNVAAPGESVIIIKDDKNKPQEIESINNAIVTATDDNSKLPNYQQWWRFLFGN